MAVAFGVLVLRPRLIFPHLFDPQIGPALGEARNKPRVPGLAGNPGLGSGKAAMAVTPYQARNNTGPPKSVATLAGLTGFFLADGTQENWGIGSSGHPVIG
jgi:hypothetical protein